MAKTCPSCGYNAIGPFTDNCPICAEPVRGVHSDGAGGSWLAHLPTAVRVLLGGVLVAVLCVAGCCGISMWRMSTAFQDAQRHALEHMQKAQAAADADRKARTVAVAAADLAQAFGADAVAADRKYAGKYLEITGVVERTGRGRHDAPFAILTGPDPTAPVKVECFFDRGGRTDEAEVKRLEKGQSIKVRGEYDGQVSNVQVRECVLVP